MSATDLLGSILKLEPNTLPKRERAMFEVVFFKYLYSELVTSFKKIIKNNQEKDMLDGSIIRSLVNELLISGEYSIQGLANYTGYSEDVIYDVSSGINHSPTLAFSTKVIELHFLARKEFYDSLVCKVFSQVGKTPDI